MANKSDGSDVDDNNFIVFILHSSQNQEKEKKNLGPRNFPATANTWNLPHIASRNALTLQRIAASCSNVYFVVLTGHLHSTGGNTIIVF